MLKSILFESLSGADVPLRKCGCFAVGILGTDVIVKDGLCTVSGVNQGTSGNRGGRTFCSLTRGMHACTPELKKIGLIL